MMPFLRFTWNTKTALPLPLNERNANVYTHASAYVHHEEDNDNLRDEVPTQPYEKTRNRKEKHKRGRPWRSLGWTEDNDNDSGHDVRNPSTATTSANGTFSQLRRRFSGKEKKTCVVDVDGSHSKTTPSIRKQHRRSRSESSTAILDIVAEPKQTPITNTIPTTTQHCPSLSTSSSATACSYSDDQLLHRRSKSLDLDEQLSRQQQLQQQQQQKQGETDREKQLRQEQELQSLQEFANSIRAFMGEFRRASAVAEAGNEIRDEAEVAEAVVEGEDEDETGVGVETEIETGSCALVEMRRMIIPPTVRRDDTPLTPIREEDEDEQLTDDDDEGGSDMQDISYTSFTSSTFSSLGVPLTPPLSGCDPFVVGSGVGMLACVPEVEEGDEEGCVDVSVASCGGVDRDKALPAPPVDRDEDTQRSSDTRSDVNSIMNAHESLICELRQNNAREDDRVAQPEVESVFGSARSRSSSIDSVISTMSMVSHCHVHESTDVEEDMPTTAVAATGAEEVDEKDADLETATEGVNASFFSAEEGLDDDNDGGIEEHNGEDEDDDDDVWAPPPNIDNTFDSILDTRSDSGSSDEEPDSDSDSSFGILLDEGTFGRGVLTSNLISESMETGLPSPSASPASDGTMEREMPSPTPSPVQQRPWGPAPSSATTSPSSSLSTSSSLGEGAKSRFGEVPFPSPTTTPTRCGFTSDTDKLQDQAQAQASSSKVSPGPKAKKGSVSLWGVGGGMGWPSCESGKERQRRVTVHDSPVSTVPLPPSPFATRTASLSSTMGADAGLYEPEQMVRPRAHVGSVSVRRRKSRTRSWWSSDDVDVDAKSWTEGEGDGGVEVEVEVEDEGRVGGGVLELDSSPDDEINPHSDSIAQVEDADYMCHDIDNVELKRALTHVNAEMRQLRARNDELVRTVECMCEDGLRKEHDHRAEVDELNRQVDELRETVRQLRARLRSSKLQSIHAMEEDADSLRQDDETGNPTSKAPSSGINTYSSTSKDKDTIIPIARRRAISDCYIVGLGAEHEIQPQPWMWTPPQTPHFMELDLLTQSASNATGSGGDLKAEVASV